MQRVTGRSMASPYRTEAAYSISALRPVLPPLAEPPPSHIGAGVTSPTRPRLGLAVSTVGRPGLAALLASAQRSTSPPDQVVIANQSGAPLELDAHGWPFELSVVTSSGGVSRGRNDAVERLRAGCDV